MNVLLWAMLLITPLQSPASQLAINQPAERVAVPAESKKLLEPVLSSLAEAWKDPKCRSNNTIARCHGLYRLYIRELDAFVQKRSPAADEAMVALFALQHPSAELRCLAASRGKRMLPLLKKYGTCNPDLRTDQPAYLLADPKICGDEIQDTRMLIQGGGYKYSCVNN